MNIRSTETAHVVIIGSAGGQDTLDSLHQDLPETEIVPISCPDPADVARVIMSLPAGSQILFLKAGDRVEPGYLSSLARHGESDAVGTLLTPTMDVRSDGTKNDHLQWRFNHSRRSVDLTTEPHIFPDTISGVVLTIPGRGLPDWGSWAGAGSLRSADDLSLIHI